MKRLSMLAVVAFSLTSTLASAQIRMPSFRALCSYEPACSKVGSEKNGQVVYRQPNPTLLRNYYGDSTMRSLIIRIAEQYNIDPVTLVAAPLAENTLNVKKLSRVIENQFDKADQYDDDGRPMVFNVAIHEPLSVGPGQIYVSVAKRVEKLAASIEGRPMRKGGEIKNELFKPEGALRYAAAILRDAQDTYAAGGIDISRRPEILATLYNIGKVSERLRNLQYRIKDTKGKAETLPNYFGYWVGLNYEHIRTELNLPSKLDR